MDKDVGEDVGRRKARKVVSIHICFKKTFRL
jgi:hypothetical protein